MPIISAPGPSNPSTFQPGGHYGPATPTYTGEPGGGGITAPGAPNAMANNMVNTANAQFASITEGLRAANEARKAKIDSEAAGQTQEARDFEFKSQNFARAQLGKIGGFEGTYGIGLQNSIAQRTEKNIQGIRRAAEEAKAQGDYDLGSRLAELGLQQMTLLAQLNQQAFEQSKFATQQEYQRGRDTIEDARYIEAQKLLGKDFVQLDNGDYGYFDKITGQFVRQGNAAKPASGGGGTVDPVSGLPKGFTTAAEDGRSELMKGVSWGDVWNRLRAQFPTVSNQQIDTFLGGSAGTTGRFSQATGESTSGTPATGWARGGAYEDFKRASLAGTYDTSSTATEISQKIFSAASTEEWGTLTPAQRKQLVLSLGGNPDDYYSVINQ